MDSLRQRKTCCPLRRVCRRSPRLRGSPESAAQKAASRPFLRPCKNSVVDTARGKARRGAARPCNAAAPTAAKFRALPTPRSSPQHRVRAPVQLSPLRPSEDARQKQPSPALSLGLPRNEAAEAKSRRIRFAAPEKEASPLIPQLGKQNTALFQRKITPPPKIELCRRARFHPPAPHRAARSKGAETTCFRCSQRCPQARPRRKVPDRHRQGRSSSTDRFRTELN